MQLQWRSLVWAKLEILVQVALEITDNESSARLVKARLEKTTLGQVADSISMTFAPSEVNILLCCKQPALHEICI